jgi:hypothetical protein
MVSGDVALPLPVALGSRPRRRGLSRNDSLLGFTGCGDPSYDGPEREPEPSLEFPGPLLSRMPREVSLSGVLPPPGVDDTPAGVSFFWSDSFLVNERRLSLNKPLRDVDTTPRDNLGRQDKGRRDRRFNACLLLSPPSSLAI